MQFFKRQSRRLSAKKRLNHAENCRRLSRRRAIVHRARQTARWVALGGIACITLALAGGGYWSVESGRWSLWMEQSALWREDQLASLSRGLGLTVHGVVMEGRERMPPEVAAAAIAVRPGDPLLTIDLAAVQMRLMETGWLESVSVRRLLPGTLQIEVQERRPLALWQDKGELRLIDRQGQVMQERDIGRYSVLPVVVGQSAPAHAPALIAMLNETPELFAKVSAAMRIGERRWNIRFYDGKEVLLPEEGMEKAWKNFAQLDAEQELLKRDILAVDMRLPSRVYLSLKAGASPVAARGAKPVGPAENI